MFQIIDIKISEHRQGLFYDNHPNIILAYDELEICNN